MPNKAEVHAGQALTLPCGLSVRNRILKSAMSEGLGSNIHLPDHRLQQLYRTWDQGGAGILVTGNVMVDGRALGEPGNVVLDKDTELGSFKAWAQAGTATGSSLWMQINHPGKQAASFASQEAVAPSAVGFTTSLRHAFPVPRELSHQEVLDTIERFATTALLAKQAGFSGVQIHGAHGYLVSQFLSPIHNVRSDQWGGSLAKRMRFVLEVYQAIRDKVGATFAVGIKLNSADFQQGGFSEDESMILIEELYKAGIDLVEVSGGTYEAPVMTGDRIAESTRKREAYFLAFAEAMRKKSDVPLCVTGGFRSSAGVQQALANGATDMAGVARPMAIDPAMPRHLIQEPDYTIQMPDLSTGLKSLDKFASLNITWYQNQIHRLAAGKQADIQLGGLRSFASTVTKQGVAAFKRKRIK